MISSPAPTGGLPPAAGSRRPGEGLREGDGAPAACPPEAPSLALAMTPPRPRRAKTCARQGLAPPHPPVRNNRSANRGSAAQHLAPAIFAPVPAPALRTPGLASRAAHGAVSGGLRWCGHSPFEHDHPCKSLIETVTPDAPVSAGPKRNAEILGSTTAVKIVPRRGPNKARIPFTANDIDTNNGEDRQAGLGVTAEITPEAAPPRHARRNSPRTGTPALAAPSPGVQNHASKPRRDRHDIPTATGRSAGRAWNF
jgi:hypothetical protein